MLNEYRHKIFYFQFHDACTKTAILSFHAHNKIAMKTYKTLRPEKIQLKKCQTKTSAEKI